MKKISTIILFLTLPLILVAQSNLKYLAHQVAKKSQNNLQLKEQKLFNSNNISLATRSNSNINRLTLDSDKLSSLLIERPDVISLTLPFQNDKIEVELVEFSPFSNDFEVIDAKTDKRYQVEKGLFYRGIVKNHPESFAAISFFKDQVMGVFSDNLHGDVTLGKAKDSQSNNEYVLFAVKDQNNLPAPPSCNMEDIPVEMPQNILQQFDLSNLVSGCVRLSLEIDFETYTFNGSNIQNTVNYIAGLMNVVYAVFNQEAISMTTSQIYIWTTPDTYVCDTNVKINSFINSRTQFNGDLAHLITQEPGGGACGGRAWMNVLCSTGIKHGVSDIDEYYSPLPNWSYSVNVLAHEIGHNLGSPHTHSCSWPGGPIDICDVPEGGCTATTTNGLHTVMSYCPFPTLHNGFGTLPGNLIRSRVQNATCLSSTCITPTCSAPSNLILTNPPLSTSATVSWVGGVGNNTFTLQYRISNTNASWTTVSNVTNPYTLTNLTVDKLYEVQIKGNCSSSSSDYTQGLIFLTECRIPTNLSSSSVTKNSATLNWTENNASTSWQLVYGNSGFNPLTSGTSININSKPYVLNGLNLNTNYDWYVRSTCAASGTGYTNFGGPNNFLTLAGDVCSWNTGSGSWNTAGNWSCGHVPNPEDNAIINSSGGVITISNDIVINGLSLISGGLTGNFNITVANNFEQNSGTIAGSGTCTIGGLYIVQPIASGSTSIAILGKDMKLNGGGSISNTSLFISDDNSFTLASGKTLIWHSNTSTSTGCFKYSSSSPASSFIIQSGAILKKTGPNEVYLDAFDIKNQGTIRVDAAVGTLFMGYVSGNNSHVGGSFFIDNGSELIINGGIHNLSNCTISGGGRFTSGQNGPVLNMTNTTIFSNQTNATCWYNTTWNWTNFNTTFNSFRQVGTINGTGNISVTYNFDMDNGPIYNVTGDININGDLNIYYGTCTLGGVGTITIGQNMNINVYSDVTVPSLLYLNRSAILKGNLNASSSISSLNLQAGKTLSLQNSANKTGNGSGTLDINGTIEKTVYTTNYTIANPLNVTTSGKIISNTGNLILNGNNTNDGTVQCSSTGNITLGNTLLNLGIIKGNGSLTTNNFLSNYGVIAPGLSPGTLTINPNIATTISTIYEMEIIGNQADQLVSNGNISLSGNLRLILQNPIQGIYTIFRSIGGSISGFSSLLSIQYSLNGGAFTSVQPNNVSIQVNSNNIVVTISSPLPIDLLSFQAQNTEGVNKLTWQTATEKNVQDFDIEKSKDGNTFVSIGTAKAVGNSNTPQFYTYLDKEPFSLTYYRLKINDLDGKTEYSKTVSVRLKPKGFSAKVYPNPLKEQATIEISTEQKVDVSIELYDVVGRLLKRLKVENTEGVVTMPMSMTDLSSGTYFLKISNNLNTIQQKIVKQ